MMLASHLPPLMPARMPRELMGPTLGSTADVQALQQALKNLAIATGRPDIDPGVVDGTVGTKTVTAVIAAQTLISSELPQWAFLTLQAALAAGAMTSTAKTAVEKAAIPLTVAANTAAVKYKQNPALLVMPTPWYKTPIGIIGILAAAFIGYKLFLAPPASNKAA